MKRFFVLMSVLVLILLSACSMLGGQGGNPPPAGTPTVLSPEQAQTEVARMLTLMPTATGSANLVASATPGLPTLAVDAATPVPNAPASDTNPTATLASQPTVTVEGAQPTAPAATNTPAPADATAVSAPSATSTSAAPAGPTFTPPANDPRGRLGSPASTDAMDNELTWIWPTGSDQYTKATFGNGVQTITALTSTDGWRLANPTGHEYTNLYLEATLRTNTCSGSDQYGLIVRVPALKDSNQGYLFGVTCDGKYSLRRWNSKIGVKGEMKWLVNWTASPAIATGSNQINRLGIFTIGSRFILYANGKLLTEMQDTTFPSGNFGVFIGSDNTNQMSIQVDEMSYWENPQP